MPALRRRQRAASPMSTTRILWRLPSLPQLASGRARTALQASTTRRYARAPDDHRRSTSTIADRCPPAYLRGRQLLLVGDHRVGIKAHATSSYTRNVSCAARRSQISCESRRAAGAVDSNHRRLSRCSPCTPPQGSARDRHLHHWSREPAPHPVQRIAAGCARTGVHHRGYQ